MKAIMNLILLFGLATLASAEMSDWDPPGSSTLGKKLDPEFPRKFQRILQQSIDKAENHIRELRIPANYTVYYKQPKGNMEATVVAAFGAMSVKGLNFLELDDDVQIYRSKKRNIYLEFFLKGQPLQFDAHVTVSSMGMGAEFQAFGKLSFHSFYANIYRDYLSNVTFWLEESELNKPVLELDAFVPKWLNRSTFLSESSKTLVSFIDAHIADEFFRRVLSNFDMEPLADVLNKFRNSK